MQKGDLDKKIVRFEKDQTDKLLLVVSNVKKFLILPR